MTHRACRPVFAEEDRLPRLPVLRNPPWGLTIEETMAIEKTETERELRHIRKIKMGV